LLARHDAASDGSHVDILHSHRFGSDRSSTCFGSSRHIRQPSHCTHRGAASSRPRAYAAVLRPLADAGYTVVIPKQPLGIAFLATGAFESTRDAHPDIDSWVVGGHSLGGKFTGGAAVTSKEQLLAWMKVCITLHGVRKLATLDAVLQEVEAGVGDISHSSDD
jgi:pimeloyl-ACP methyl ester carboxylesterase